MSLRSPGVTTVLKAVEARHPKVKSMKPEDLVDSRLVWKFDKGGVIAELTRSKQTVERRFVC
jgi:hypothetical protein